MVIQSNNNLNDNLSSISMLSTSTTELVHNHISQPDLQSMNPQSITTMDNNVGTVANDGRIIGSVDVANHNTSTSTLTIDDHSGFMKQDGKIIGEVHQFAGVTTINNNVDGSTTQIPDNGVIMKNGTIVGDVNSFGDTTTIRDNAGNITRIDKAGNITKNGMITGHVENFGGETKISKT